jgi:hypothetical protein
MNSAAEEKAFKAVVAYLERFRRQRIGVDGYTYSDPTAFNGRWWNPPNDHAGWISDRVILLLADFKIDLTSPVSLAAKVAELKEKIHQSYVDYGKPQDEIWIVSHVVTRHL